MENASKALIIAGAILISILLIGVGVLVMNAVNPVTEGLDGQSQAWAKQQFNAQFTGYLGEQSAAQVRSLLSAIKSSNGTEGNPAITLDSTGDITSFNANVTTGSKYTVTVDYADTGYISTIKIKKGTT